MNKENKNILDIECPHCYQDNKVNLSQEIKCKHCKEPLIGEKYKKPIITAFTAILLGSSIGITTDAYLNINRASVKTEYKMMKTCIDYKGYSKTVRDNCACTVESMLGVIDAQKARFYSESKLYRILDERYEGCID